MPSLLTKIVSGGQTGVDRAGLDAAIFLNLPHGGWCPQGRRSEDGTIPTRYELRETTSRNYAVRTEQNVIDSDATLILFEDALSRGTELTAKFASKRGRPMIAVDMVEFTEWEDERFASEVAKVVDWIVAKNINVLNIAGPRESSSPGIGGLAQAFLVRVFEVAVAAEA